MASNYVRNYQRKQKQRGADKQAQIDALSKEKAELNTKFKADQLAQFERNKQSPTPPSKSALEFQQYGMDRHKEKMEGLDSQIEAIKNKEQSAKEKGIDTALDILGPEGLERMGDDRDVQDVLSRKKKIADEGIGLAEREQMRSRMAQQMGQAQQLAGFKLGGALGGAKGAGVAAQQRSLAAQGMAARAGIESDIFMASEAAKRKGLESYASSLGEVKTFDIGQAAKERDIMFQSIMGYEQMASSERAAELEAEAARKAACHVAGTKVLMADESYKSIEEIKVGDEIALGGVVYGTGVVMHVGNLYKYKEELVTGSHLIYSQQTDTFVRAEELEEVEEIEKKETTLVYPIYTENRCYFTTFLSGDFAREEDDLDVRRDYVTK